MSLKVVFAHFRNILNFRLVKVKKRGRDFIPKMLVYLKASLLWNDGVFPNSSKEIRY